VTTGPGRDASTEERVDASPAGAPPDRGTLPTERTHADAVPLDRAPLAEAIAFLRREDARAVDAVAAAGPAIERAVELIAARLAGGGRLVYVGAGTSGRLAALDACECPPTFQSDPELVQAIVAGGREALVRSVEGAEDDTRGARRAVAERDVGAGDVVVGIAAGGTTPFVHAALAEARARGAATVFLACVPFDQAPDAADLSIRLDTGPEVLTGSTRLKAGTATKLVLNTLTTLAFARLGKVHGNCMVDVNTRANAKLVDRGVRLVMDLAGLERDAAFAALEEAGGSVKLAVCMRRLGLGADAARERLAAADGVLARALA